MMQCEYRIIKVIQNAATFQVLLYCLQLFCNSLFSISPQPNLLINHGKPQDNRHLGRKVLFSFSLKFNLHTI